MPENLQFPQIHCSFAVSLWSLLQMSYGPTEPGMLSEHKYIMVRVSRNFVGLWVRRKNGYLMWIAMIGVHAFVDCCQRTLFYCSQLLCTSLGNFQQWLPTMLSTHRRHLCSKYWDAPTMKYMVIKIIIYQTTGKRIAPQQSKSTRMKTSRHVWYSMSPSSDSSIMISATLART